MFGSCFILQSGDAHGERNEQLLKESSTNDLNLFEAIVQLV